MDIVVTLPRQVSWKIYEAELDAVADWKGDLLYRVAQLPPVVPHDRCYLVWRGAVRGWMSIIAARRREGFHCAITGKWWPAGKYIIRSGPFHRIHPIPMRGFPGWWPWRGAPAEETRN